MSMAGTLVLRLYVETGNARFSTGSLAVRYRNNEVRYEDVLVRTQRSFFRESPTAY